MPVQYACHLLLVFPRKNVLSTVLSGIPGVYGLCLGPVSRTM
jgi:hypothetical protein